MFKKTILTLFRSEVVDVLMFLVSFAFAFAVELVGFFLAFRWRKKLLKNLCFSKSYVVGKPPFCFQKCRVWFVQTAPKQTNQTINRTSHQSNIASFAP